VLLYKLSFSPQLNRDRIRDARDLVLTAKNHVYEWVRVHINTYNLVEGRFDVIAVWHEVDKKGEV